MDIVFLDQNKWIELARVHSGQITSGPLAELFPQLVAAVEGKRVLFPLTASNIMETAKRNDHDSRRHVAETQAILSLGYVHRSRASRMSVELRAAIQRRFGEEPVAMPPNWAFAPGFMQAFEPMDELNAVPEERAGVRGLNSLMHPAALYLDFMVHQEDVRRRKAIAALTQGLAELVVRIESRRQRLVNKSIDFRRRAYAAQSWVENLDLLHKTVAALGYSFDQLRALGDQALRALLEDVPTMNVEVEMAARLESKTGVLSPNDALDLQSFYTAIPYAGRIVAEKAAISRAKQARLDSKYRVALSRSLEDLLNLYVG
ncbi:hypothetical protein P3W70_19045 [Achromobacter denitrificans]|uniref:hypothetical protein n=1 Tax=Achromobacter denitrificans TaxID=32002 RepID=UPI0023E81E27|nr:hypothetical protein [Achromobacter denitrificans]MDF3860458.1 hypothetical protein [Achromobacter denitrificans]